MNIRSKQIMSISKILKKLDKYQIIEHASKDQINVLVWNFHITLKQDPGPNYLSLVRGKEWEKLKIGGPI